MEERTEPVRRDPARPSPIGLWAFGLGAASTVVYFATSEGIRNFAAFLASSVAKVMAAIGHGA